MKGEIKQFEFKINKKAVVVDSYYPTTARLGNVLSEEEFDSVISHVNRLLKKPRHIRKKLERYKVATYATCICLVGLVVFLPLMIHYMDMLIGALNVSFTQIHSYFRKLNKKRYNIRWKIVKRYRDIYQAEYSSNPYSFNWWDREQPVIENYEREEYIIILQLSRN